MTEPHDNDDLDPALADALDWAFAERVDVEAAARHLWSIHQAAPAQVPAVPAPAPVGRARARRSLVTVLAGSMMFMSSGGALAASGAAVPGDVLYPVKRGAESARMMLSMSSETDAQLHIAYAMRRIDEAQAAVRRSRPTVVPDLVREAAKSLEVAERVGGPRVAREAKAVREQATDRIVVLAPELDDPSREKLRSSASRLGGPEAEGRMLAAVAASDSFEDPGSSDGAAPSESASPSQAPSPMTSASSSPSATPSESTSPSSSPSATTSPSATPSESTSPSSSPSATTSPSSSPSATTSPSSSPSATTSPSTSPSASPSPSESPSESTSPTASTSPSPSSSTEPSSGTGTRRYEGVEDASPSPAPGPSPAPSG